MRKDLEIISQWIQPESRVLDLGCGDGTLLAHLQDHKGVLGYGVEIDTQNVIQCLRKGVEVIHTDIDKGLDHFEDKAFDYVLTTHSLQTMHYPHKLLDDMLRIGQQGIVSFPNFGFWKIRLQLALRGRMPVTRSLPAQWYDTPNIHFFTIADFEAFCDEHHYSVLERSTVNNQQNNSIGAQFAPNLLASNALYRLECKT